MIDKPIWMWKGIPSDWGEFFKEVFVLWLGSALVFGLLIAFITLHSIILVVNR